MVANASGRVESFTPGSYLVNIKPNHSRIRWYKKKIQSKIFKPYLRVSFWGWCFPKLPPTAISYGNVYRCQKPTNPFGFDWNLQNTMCWCQRKYVPKIIKFCERLSQKTARGDNWPAAITGRLPVHVNQCSEFSGVYGFCTSPRGRSNLRIFGLQTVTRMPP